MGPTRHAHFWGKHNVKEKTIGIHSSFLLYHFLLLFFCFFFFLSFFSQISTYISRGLFGKKRPLLVVIWIKILKISILKWSFKPIRKFSHFILKKKLTLGALWVCKVSEKNRKPTWSYPPRPIHHHRPPIQSTVSTYNLWHLWRANNYQYDFHK